MARRQQPEDPIPPINETAEHNAFLLYVAHPELTLTEIAEMVGENPNTLRTWKYRRKWDKGLKEMREMMARRRPTREEPHVVSVVETRDERSKSYVEDMSHGMTTLGKHVKGLSAEKIIEDAPKLDAADKMFGRRLKLDEPEQAGQGGHISLTFLGAAAEGAVRIVERPKPAELGA